VRQSLAFESRPWPGGVEATQMVALSKLVRQLEVMEDAEDGLDDLHR
jgi:hypothetical protein